MRSLRFSLDGGHHRRLGGIDVGVGMITAAEVDYGFERAQLKLFLAGVEADLLDHFAKDERVIDLGRAIDARLFGWRPSLVSEWTEGRAWRDRRKRLSMARRISSEVAPQNSPVRRAGISRWVERRLHCWAAFRDVLAWTG